jgi:UDP-2,3-diacylglucosamine hydrolase
MTGEPAPVAREFRADPGWRVIDLLSDVHLQPEAPRTVAAWRLHMLQTPADAVLILGDLFEVWVGDDARHAGFEAECVAVLREASSHRALAFLPGNRDFLVGDMLLSEAGIRRLADPTVLLAFGQRWLLSHGDALCLADVDYQAFRAAVRGAAWQQAFLALPLAERQRQARVMRDASSAHQAGKEPGQWSDVDGAAAVAWLAETATSVLIHGHTHRPARHPLAGGRAREVLGDWDFDGATPRARILRLTPEGLQSIDLAAAAPTG